ncbi:MAG: hypothetical protein JJE40_08620 [Vicinamibacteria bacterium]|nr:hypothetical protein [Vicinamibacteria bacterium]
MSLGRALALLLGLVALDTSAEAADRGHHRRATDEPVRVFLDCVETRCDFDYLRTEIAFVDYVRTRQDADVHVMVTSQRTGSGIEYAMRFIGLDRFDGQTDDLTYSSSDTDTADERRAGFARMLSLGLVRYVITTAAGRDLRVVVAGQGLPREQSPARQSDPWNYWVFRSRLASRVDAESSVSSYGVNGALSANRTTDAWRTHLSADAAYWQSDYDLGGEDPYRGVSRNSGVRAVVVKSLSDRWSAGLRASVTSSTYVNQDLAGRVAPAIEYNLFPYAESTRRRLTLQYAAGVRRFVYDQVNVFGYTEETRWDHSFEAALDLKRPWGTINASVDGAQYLDDPQKYRLNFDNEFDIRLFRGLSLSLTSAAAVIRDQIYLPAGEATAEEILVRQRQLETGYRYQLSVGFSYTFGSIFNNVVNRRFGG